MNKLLTAVAFVALIGFSTAASAQVAASSPSFAGAYVGGEVGGSSLAPADTAKDNLALTYDGIAGYNFALSNGFVVGAEGTFGKTDTQNYTYTVGGRVGHTLVSPTTMGYVKVAYAGTNMDVPTGGSSTATGVLAGVGVETFLTQKISGKLEGDYVDYTNLASGADPSNVAVKVGVAYHF